VSPIVAAAAVVHFIAAGAGLTACRLVFAIKPTAVLLGILLLRGLREPQRAREMLLNCWWRVGCGGGI